jgi:hypothetical protein
MDHRNRGNIARGKRNAGSRRTRVGNDWWRGRTWRGARGLRRSGDCGRVTKLQCLRDDAEGHLKPVGGFGFGVYQQLHVWPCVGWVDVARIITEYDGPVNLGAAH